MVCAACLAVPLAALGIGSMHYNTLIGLLLTIFSCAVYLHYKTLMNNGKGCEYCTAF